MAIEHPTFIDDYPIDTYISWRFPNQPGCMTPQANNAVLDNTLEANGLISVGNSRHVMLCTNV